MAIVDAAFLGLFPALAGLPPALLAQLAEAASDTFEALCNRTGFGFEEETLTEEVYDGPGSRMMFLNRTPVTDLATIFIRESDDTFTSLDNTGDDVFYIKADTGQIVFANDPATSPDRSFFPTGFQNVKATYTGGYTDALMPNDIKQAVAEIAMIMGGTSTGGAVQSEKLGDYSVKFAALTASGLPPLTSAVVSKYKRLNL